MGQKRKLHKNGIANGIIPLIYIIMIALCALSIFFCVNLAPSIGKVMGRAIGSKRGIENGIENGYNDGKTEGISAKDTSVRIKDRIIETGKLQIMMVDLNLTDLYQQGKDYAALFALHGEGVFSVDLTCADVTYDEGSDMVSIVVPYPEFTPYLDDSKVETIAEYTRPLFDGKTEVGYQSYLNSREEIDKRLSEELTNDLRERAEASGIKQIEMLARSVCGKTSFVKVDYKEKED